MQSAGQERFIRCKSLGKDYTEEAIRERLSGKRMAVPKPKAAAPLQAPRKPNLFIDIQTKFQQGYGPGWSVLPSALEPWANFKTCLLAMRPGFERFAKIYNLKEAAKTLIFLQERGLMNYKNLTMRAEAASKDFSVLMDKIKASEKRMNEISVLQKHVGTYRKTRDVYVHFDSLGPKKWPSSRGLGR